MASNGEQFVTDAEGKCVGVMLDLDTYERLCQAEAELNDIRDYDDAKPQVDAEVKAGEFSTLAEHKFDYGKVK
jgi:hypothetical protein